MRVEITTERLRLVPIGEANVSSLFAYAGDPETARLMAFLPFADEAEAAEFLRRADEEWRKPRPDAYEFAVLLDGAHVGGVSLYMEDGAGELGWIIRREYWRRGIALEAARALVAYFSAHGVRRFIAHCDAENEPSRRLMERLGMQPVSLTAGRRNRGSDEERREWMYLLDV